MPLANVFRTSGSFARFINVFSGEDDGTGFGASGPYCFYLPRALTLHTGTIARATAPGSSATTRLECLLGAEGGTQTGSDVDLDDPNTSVRGSISGSWTASSDATVGSGRCIALSDGAGSPALDDTNVSILYDDAATDGISYYGFGDRVANILSGAGTSARYTTFGVSDAVSATQSDVQLPWPIAGTFQHVAILYAVGTSTGPVTVVLQIAGSDTALTFSLSDTSGAATLTTNSALSATVTAGQLVGWRIQNAAGTASFSCALVCGFIPD